MVDGVAGVVRQLPTVEEEEGAKVQRLQLQQEIRAAAGRMDAAGNLMELEGASVNLCQVLEDILLHGLASKRESPPLELPKGG